MSQEQPRRQEGAHRDSVKYGDVFCVSGDLAKEPIAPEDAVTMQTMETIVFGQVQPGGAGMVMGGAAVVNQRIGMDTGGDKNVTVTAMDYPSGRVVTESVEGQVVGQYYQVTQAQQGTGSGTNIQSKLTIGEALEAVARVVGDKPVDRSDAAAIQEAETIATGTTVMTPGGVAETAISAADFNNGIDKDEDKIKLSYVLAGVTARLPEGKVVTMEDADRVAEAVLRNSHPNLTNNPAGVAVSGLLPLGSMMDGLEQKYITGGGSAEVKQC